MSGTVWSAASAGGDGPFEDIVRAIRPALVALCAGLPAGGSGDKSLSIEFGPSRTPTEVRLRVIATGALTFRARDALGYNLVGALHAPGGWVDFKGRVVFDVATGAVMDLRVG